MTDANFIPVDFDPFCGGEVAQTIPVSEPQQEIWMSCQMGDDANCSYNESQSLYLTGPLDVEAFHAAIQQLVERHESLRATFAPDGQTSCLLFSMPIETPLVDLTAMPDADKTARLAEILHQDMATPFDLEFGPLLRVQIVRLAPDEHQVILTAHHIVCDGWSWGILIPELRQLYAAALVGLPAHLPPPPTFSDYAVFLEQQDFSVDEQYWVDQFAGDVPTIDLPLDHPRPQVRTFNSHQIDWKVDAALVDRLKRAKVGVSFFNVLLAAFEAFVYRLTGQGDLVVGLSVAGQTTSGYNNLIGHCVSFLPLRARIEGGQSFKAYAASRRSAVLDAFDRHHFSFGSLLSRLNIPRDPSRIPLVPITFNLDQTLNADDIQFQGLKTRLFANPRLFDSFEFSINASYDGRSHLVLECQYNSDLFDAATIERRMAEFETMLGGIASNPAQSIAALPLLTDAERQTMLVDWNDTAMDYPAEATIHQLFEEQVARTPKAEAVVFDGQSLTYDQLNRRANQVAHALRGMGVGPESMVGLFVERSIEMVVAVLGVLKAGGAYVPLDPMYPAERLAYMLSDSGAKVLLTQDHLVGALAFAGQTVYLDADWPEIATRSETNPERVSGPEDLAYVIYTSGSTGQPKGVMVEHRGVVNYLSWAIRYFQVEAGCGAPVNSSLSFDATVTSLFSPLLTGKKIVLVPGAHEIYYLTDILRGGGDFSLLKITPAHLTLLSQLLSPEEAGGRARVFVIGGEALPPASLEFWQRHAPATRLVNHYGPTETVVARVVYTVPPDYGGEESVPIGKPIGNTLAYVLDANLQPAPIGVPGELHIGGAGVARGYLNRPELTAQKFIANPFGPGRIYKTGDLVRWRADGNLDFLGRIDHQVKIRGYRIELGEIETTLARHERVREAVVMAQAGPGGKRLVAWLTADGDAPEALELRAWLKQTLPEYMVPAVFVVLDEFPLTPNGKIDRKALPEPSGADAGSAGYVAPQTETEQKLAAIWQEVLDVPQVGATDNFFELGGHSLLAIQIMVRLGDAFGVELPLRALFEHPTVEGLAEQIDITRWAAGGDDTPSDDMPEETEEFVL